MYKKRLNRIVDMMQKNDMEQLIVSSPTAIFYLSGVMIEPMERFYALLIDSKEGTKLFVNDMFCIPEETIHEKVWLNDNDDAPKVLSKYLKDNAKIGVDKDFKSGFLFGIIKEKPSNDYVNGSFVVDLTRTVKDSEEIKLMKESSAISDRVITELIEASKGGLSELELADQLQQIYKKNGVLEYSFDPIVAYGANAADPHHICDDTRPQKGECMLFDIGGIKNSYCSDITRTVFFGKPDDLSKKIYEIVKEANLRGIEAAKPGARFCDIDKAARDYIDSFGYGKYFTHRLGHSIGLTDHEFGDVSAANEMQVKPGMIFSVEPGIYLPGKIGVRIEDLLVITENGNELLNHVDKSLTVV